MKLKNIGSLALLFFLASCHSQIATTKATASTSAPVKLIVDTDLGNDIDDALALDIVYKAIDSGDAELLGIGNHKLSPTATTYIDILNTWYGYPDIPLARSLTPVENNHANDYTIQVCAMTDSTGKYLYKRSKTESDIENPTTMYRRLLAKQPDKSVVFVSLGFGTELAKLLDSKPDSISNLDGTALVATKVKMLSIMAGSYGKKQRAEFNVVNDIPAMKKVFESWPTPIVQNPFELGIMIQYPGNVIENGFTWAKHHPVVDGYKNYHKMPYNRATWDLLSIVYVLKPEYFNASEPGVITVDDKGYTHFTPSAEGKHIWLSSDSTKLAQMREYIINVTTRQPIHYSK